ncbi:MAG: squalene synthase HpnC [Sphingomonadaceae bacterium]|nr:squalene synthase HpnC [Sphingomonadaceae bacterium]
MTDLSSGKGHRDENFPVASRLIAARHRPAIMAFYRFARAADDVSDHPSAPPHEKLRLLNEMAATLSGEADVSAEARALRQMCAAAGVTPQHGLDLLEAFRRDVTKLRYANWAELMDYCRYSASPVGRFVCDVHGESRALWPANDALCSALQVINHLQDCAKDRRNLDRVYLPEDELAAAGACVADLDAPRSSPALRRVIVGLADRCEDLLAKAKPFACGIRDRGLALEVAAIQALAEDLARTLQRRDPLADTVHHTKSQALLIAGAAALRRLIA